MVEKIHKNINNLYENIKEFEQNLLWYKAV